LPRSTAFSPSTEAWNFMVYHWFGFQAKGTVFDMRDRTGGQVRICSCWLDPIMSSVYRWATRPMSGSLPPLMAPYTSA